MKRKTKFNFPEKHEPGTDKYFLNSKKILKAEKINPYVEYQIFIRKGPGITAGIDEAISFIMKFSPSFSKNGGEIYALYDGVEYQPTETLINVCGPVQDIITLETGYLSILSGRTSKANGSPDPDLNKIRQDASEIVNIMEKSKFGPRPLSYFGARHFAPELDAKIARAAYEGGASSASTDIGAGTFGQKGVGTMPHALAVSVAISLAEKYGADYALENYAVETMKAFDRHIGKETPRIFLADTFNKEITDTIKVAEELGDRFWGPRFDTNGAVITEGGKDFDGREYWTGKGVTIEGVAAARKKLNEAGYSGLKIALTSGFSNPKKIAEFVKAEEKYNMKLFDFIGAGFADDQYVATADIVRYRDDKGDWRNLHKIGRPPVPNPRLEKVDLSVY